MSNCERAKSIWDRPEPGARRPRHTREEIAAAALAIADRDGFDAVSMRRVAREIGAGTMTLYHYLRTKDDLVDLMDDAIMGEVLLPADELPASWREALGGSRGGPNGMRHFEQSLAAVAELDLDARAKLEVIAIVDDYVFGFVFRASEIDATLTDTLQEEMLAELQPYFEAQLETGEYPNIEALFANQDTRATWRLIVETMTAESRFEQGLGLLLDGIEAGLASA
jgi:AcrR family transcriptional regulator